jgi:hypothetical protein
VFFADLTAGPDSGKVIVKYFTGRWLAVCRVWWFLYGGALGRFNFYANAGGVLDPTVNKPPAIIRR